MGWPKADIDAADLWELTDILETGTPHAEHEAELPPIDSSQLNFEEIARTVERGRTALAEAMAKGASDG